MYHILNRFVFGHKSTRCLIGAAAGCKLCRFGSFKRACNKQDTRNLLRCRSIEHLLCSAKIRIMGKIKGFMHTADHQPRIGKHRGNDLSF